MGARFEFLCPDCGYSAIVSGGWDRGFVAMTETRVCDHCREVVDVLVGEESSLIGKGEARHVTSMGEGRNDGLERCRDRCPICDRALRDAWDGTCPRCGGRMVMGEGTVEMWD